MFFTSLFLVMTTISSPTCETSVSMMPTKCELLATTQSVVFRSTQKLSAKDGREIYFYSNGRCEGYYCDRLEFSTKYKIQDNEIRLLDENGNTLYKGTVRWRERGKSLSVVSIAGTSYYAR